MFLSRYVHFIKVKNNIYCLYNSLNSSKAYVNFAVHGQETNELSSKTILALQKSRILLNDYKTERKFIDSLRQKSSYYQPSQLYLIVSEICNFRCKYCRQYIHGKPNQSAVMDFSAARQAIDYFFLQALKPTGTVFYGGEPMINSKLILKCIEYIKSKYKNSIRADFDFTIITNGTLIDNKTAKSLAQYGVYIIISLDGPAPLHNRFRIYKNGCGTAKDVLAGYKTYVKNGCLVGISCTIGKHNFRHLDRTLNYIKNELKPVNIGINLPHGNDANVLVSGLNKKQIGEDIFKKLSYFNSGGLYVEHIMRKLKLIFTEQVKVNDCPACGGRLVILPNKKIGFCEGAIGMNNFFYSQLRNKKNIDKYAKKWFLTSPLFNKECQSCVALSVCGGGCPLDGYLKHKKLSGRDEVRCSFIRSIIEWSIRDFYKFSIDHKFIKNDFDVFTPSITQQDMFLNYIGAQNKKLPLRSSSRYGITKISK
jgi:uncharacterized protein